MIDLATVQRSLNGIKSLTVGKAIGLLRIAQRAVELAISVADDAADALAGQLSGTGTRARLKVTIDESLTTLGNYDVGLQLPDDLLASVKGDLTSAMVEVNAAIEGANSRQADRDQILTDMANNASNLGAGIIDSIASAFSLTSLGLAIGVVIVGGGLAWWFFFRKPE